MPTNICFSQKDSVGIPRLRYVDELYILYFRDSSFASVTGSPIYNVPEASANEKRIQPDHLKNFPKFVRLCHLYPVTPTFCTFSLL
jgi:hypothetical protein